MVGFQRRLGVIPSISRELRISDVYALASECLGYTRSMTTVVTRGFEVPILGDES